MKMRRASAIHLCAKLHIPAKRSFGLLSALGWGAAQLSTPASAQSLSPQALAAALAAQPFCSVQTAAALKASMPVGTLIAFCGTHGVVLGHADTYKVIANESAKALLVDISNNGVRKILLVSDQGDAQPLLEDISGQIALNAGRGPMGRLEDVDIDLSSFASDGAIGVAGHAAGAESGKTGRIDLAQQVASVRAARAAVSN